MKIMITILRKNGECRTWTNASAEEHLVMGLTAYAEGVKKMCGIMGKRNGRSGKSGERSAGKREIKYERIRENRGRNRKHEK